MAIASNRAPKLENAKANQSAMHFPPAEKEAATSRKLSGRSAHNTGETRDKIGAFAGVSGRTVDKIAELVAAAEAEP